MSDVGRYRKLYPRVWRHPGFRGLSPSARELALYLVSGPQTNRIGLFHFSIATAAEDLGTSVDTCRTRLRDVSATFGWLYDAGARVVYIPSWWKWNCPDNPHVLTGNLKDLSEVPPSALGEAFARNLQFLPDTWHETFIDTCRTRLAIPVPTQDQEQEQGSGKQEQKQKQEQASPQNARRREFVPRTKNEERKEGSDDEHRFSIALEVMKVTNPASSMDHLFDTFNELNPHKCSKAEALDALNAALLEVRGGRRA